MPCCTHSVAPTLLRALLPCPRCGARCCPLYSATLLPIPIPASFVQVALVLAELAAHRAATHELYEILQERDFFEQVITFSKRLY